MAVMEKAVAAIARLASAFQLQPILDYLKETLPLELDFKHEAAALTELRTVFGHRSDVLIPTSVPVLSTEDVLVMDFIDGIKITDRQTLVNAGISPHAVAQLLNDLYADQMLHLGILHGDPRPGNLLVQPGPRLVLLDHGLTVPLTPSRADSLRRMVQSLTMGDFDELTKALAGAGIQFNEQVDINALLRLVGVVLGLIDGITKQLDPELDTLEIIARYV